jgi:pectinesterase
MSNMVKPEGWNNWGKTENEKTTFYAEYKNTGEGASTGKRVPWSHQLSRREAREYTIANIFGDWDPRK